MTGEPDDSKLTRVGDGEYVRGNAMFFVRPLGPDDGPAKDLQDWAADAWADWEQLGYIREDSPVVFGFDGTSDDTAVIAFRDDDNIMIVEPFRDRNPPLNHYIDFGTALEEIRAQYETPESTARRYWLNYWQTAERVEEANRRNFAEATHHLWAKARRYGLLPPEDQEQAA